MRWSLSQCMGEISDICRIRIACSRIAHAVLGALVRHEKVLGASRSASPAQRHSRHLDQGLVLSPYVPYPLSPTSNFSLATPRPGHALQRQGERDPKGL